jgi:hypothetical protein
MVCLFNLHGIGRHTSLNQHKNQRKPTNFTPGPIYISYDTACLKVSSTHHTQDIINFQEYRECGVIYF